MLRGMRLSPFSSGIRGYKAWGDPTPFLIRSVLANPLSDLAAHLFYKETFSDRPCILCHLIRSLFSTPKITPDSTTNNNNKQWNKNATWSREGLGKRETRVRKEEHVSNKEESREPILLEQIYQSN
eukprot:gene5794-4144_t